MLLATAEKNWSMSSWLWPLTRYRSSTRRTRCRDVSSAANLVVVLFLHSREQLSACRTKSQCRRSPPKLSKQWAVSSVHHDESFLTQGSDIASNRNFPWTMQQVRSMLGLMYLSNSLLVKTTWAKVTEFVVVHSVLDDADCVRPFSDSLVAWKGFGCTPFVQGAVPVLFFQVLLEKTQLVTSSRPNLLPASARWATCPHQRSLPPAPPWYQLQVLVLWHYSRCSSCITRTQDSIEHAVKYAPLWNCDHRMTLTRNLETRFVTKKSILLTLKIKKQ